MTVDTQTADQMIATIREEKGEEYVERHRERIDAQLRLLGYL